MLNELEASHQQVRQQMEQDRNVAARNSYLRIRRERAEAVLKAGDRLALVVKCLAWVIGAAYILTAFTVFLADLRSVVGIVFGGLFVTLQVWAILIGANFIKALGRSSASTLMMACDRYEAEVPLPAVERSLTDI